ncbi:hypothetical protein BH10BAC5_BH10BAC5_27100 [soil metagenome]
MKRTYFISMFIAFTFAVFYIGCNKAEDVITPPPTGGGDGATLAITSTTQGSLNYDGFSIVVEPGDVPTNADGSAGTVTFSLNSSSSIESGVTPVPSGYTVIGKYLKAGPESFNFNGPITVYFPASSQASPQGLMVMIYRPDLNTWKIVPPGTIDSAGKRIGIDVLSLGYYVLVKSSTTTDLSDFRQGGCVFDREDLWTNYILTVKSATLEKPEQLALFDGGYIGKVYTGPQFQCCPNGKTKAIVPQGTIEFWVSIRVCQGSDQNIYTYSLPATVTVSEPLNFLFGWSTYEAVTYVPFILPTGGTMVLGRPTGTGGWPTPTIPYGSGVFQATLTWTNSSGDAADMDLHLYGPNNLHVYYGNRTTTDFSLDRDWQSALGAATENIYSLRNVMPSGDYTIKVKNYNGVTKAYNCRTVLNGTAANFSGTLAATIEATVRTFTIP